MKRTTKSHDPLAYGRPQLGRCIYMFTYGDFTKQTQFS